MLRKIFKYGDPVLETRCDPVSEFGTSELRKLVDDMFETMYEAPVSREEGHGVQAARMVSAKSRRTAVAVIWGGTWRWCHVGCAGRFSGATIGGVSPRCTYEG